MELKKMYFSLPISGRNLDDVKQRADKIKRSYKSNIYELITPFDICPDSTLEYNVLMGKDIERLLVCDAILLDYDWQESKGCRAEKAIAEIYGLHIYAIADNGEFVSDDESQLFRITLNRKQLKTLSDMCDSHSRILCGQLDQALKPIAYKAMDKEYPNLKDDERSCLRGQIEVKCAELASLAWNCSPTSGYGIKYDADADIIYDMHQVIRHQLWLAKPEPKSCITNDAYPAMKFGSEPLITIESIRKDV